MCGAQVLWRPKELATDTASSEDALLHFAENVSFDILVFIQPTSPLLSETYINDGIKMMDEYDSVFSAYREHWIPRWTLDSKPIDWDIYDQKIVDAWGWITLKLSDLSGSADYNILDQKIIDGVSHITNYSSKKLKKTQSGVLQNYLLAGFAGLVVLILLIKQII